MQAKQLFADGIHGRLKLTMLAAQFLELILRYSLFLGGNMSRSQTSNVIYQQIEENIRKAKIMSSEHHGIIASEVLATDKFSSIVMSVCAASDTDCACS